MLKTQKLRVLYLCTGSQMAKEWTRKLKSDCIEAYSPGIDPGGLSYKAAQVMYEAEEQK